MSRVPARSTASLDRDAVVEVARVYLAPGRLYASASPVLVTTILGSCVAVCLWDQECEVGGINHFLLPSGGPPASARFGEGAVPLLVAEVLGLGARRAKLKAKVLGGASTLPAYRRQADTLGLRNVEVARQRLQAEGVPVVAEDVGGHLGRKLVFEVQTGTVWVRPIGVTA
jgi:chemotaxis protein CheD